VQRLESREDGKCRHLVLRRSAPSIYVEHSYKLERSLQGRDVWFVTEVIHQLCVSPSRNWQDQSTRNRFKARRSELVYRWGRKIIKYKYMQKEILHRNRKQCAMIHSRIKWLHTQEDTTMKQKTIRSQNTISEKDCRDLTTINRQRKHEGFDRILPKVKLRRNHPKGQCCSLPKKRTREEVLRARTPFGRSRGFSEWLREDTFRRWRRAHEKGVGHHADASDEANADQWRCVY